MNSDWLSSGAPSREEYNYLRERMCGAVLYGLSPPFYVHPCTLIAAAAAAHTRYRVANQHRVSFRFRVDALLRERSERLYALSPNTPNASNERRAPPRGRVGRALMITDKRSHS